MARTAREMAALGLVTGSSGNVSLRRGDTILITPTGVPYNFLNYKQIVAVHLTEEKKRGLDERSSEWRMHVAIYKSRSDVQAIVHTHSPWATVASALPALPVFYDEGRVFFGEIIPVSHHAPAGTWALAKAVTEALGKEGKGILIARHGVVTVGRTPTEALELAIKLEEIAQNYLLNKMILNNLTS